jgi:hypothetical protein
VQIFLGKWLLAGLLSRSFSFEQTFDLFSGIDHRIFKTIIFGSLTSNRNSPKKDKEISVSWRKKSVRYFFFLLNFEVTITPSNSSQSVSTMIYFPLHFFFLMRSIFFPTAAIIYDNTNINHSKMCQKKRRFTEKQVLFVFSKVKKGKEKVHSSFVGHCRWTVFMKKKKVLKFIDLIWTFVVSLKDIG